MSSSFQPLGILPPPPYRLRPDHLQRHRRNAWLSLLGAVACAAIGYISSLDREVQRLEYRFDYAYMVFALAFAVLAFRSLRSVQLGRLVCTAGVEALCQVLDVKAQKTRAGTILAHLYTVVVPDGRTVKVSMPDKAGKLLHLRGDHVLALVVESLPKHPLLLYQNLWPLALEDEQVRAVAGRLQQVDPDGGWRIAETQKGPRLLCARDLDGRATEGAGKRRAERG